MGRMVWGRACFWLAFLSLLPAAACSGDDFESEGSGGSGAGAAGSSGGSAGAAAQCGAAAAAGAAGADVNDCTSELYCKGCDQVSTALSSCDECARTNCCQDAVTCMADPDCARLMVCFFKRCTHQSASVCIFDQCSDCLGNIGQFTKLAACIDNHCKGDGTDASTDPCPHLVP
jgi:hypothetical protein